MVSSNLNRLLSCKRDAIYKIFTITDPGFVSLILKMINQLTNINHNKFSFPDANTRERFASQKEFALAKHNLIMRSNKNHQTTLLNMNIANDMEKKKRTKENLLLKKTRLFKKNNVFDSFTFTHDFLNQVDEAIKCFEISKIYLC